MTPKFNGFGGDRLRAAAERQLEERKGKKKSREQEDRSTLLKAYGVEGLHAQLEEKGDGIIDTIKQHGEAREKGEMDMMREYRAFNVTGPSLNSHAIDSYRDSLGDEAEGLSDEDLVKKAHEAYVADVTTINAGRVKWLRNPRKIFEAMGKSDERRKAAERVAALERTLNVGHAGFERTPAFDSLDSRAYEQGYRLRSAKEGPFVVLQAEAMTEAELIVRAAAEELEAAQVRTETAGDAPMSAEQIEIIRLQRENEALKREGDRDNAVNNRAIDLLLRLAPLLAKSDGTIDLKQELTQLIALLKEGSGPAGTPIEVSQAA